MASLITGAYHRSADLITDAYRRFTELISELAKFGVVGAIAAVIDLGGAAYLHGVLGIGPLSAKAIAIAAATVVSYVGNRFWTFRHRGGHALLREWVVFIVLNVIGLLIAEISIGFTYYVLGLHDAIAYNVASVAGTGLATVFRYWSYKKWVFIALDGDGAEPVSPELTWAGTHAGPLTADAAATSSAPGDVTPGR
jgi:putative flippase GtrA